MGSSPSIIKTYSIAEKQKILKNTIEKYDINALLHIIKSNDLDYLYFYVPNTNLKELTDKEIRNILIIEIFSHIAHIPIYSCEFSVASWLYKISSTYGYSDSLFIEDIHCLQKQMIKILIQHNNISVFKRIIENLTYYNIRLCMFVMLIEETNYIEFIEYLFCKLTKNVMNNVVQENMFHTVQTIMNTCINKINLLKQNRIPLLKWCIKQETEFHKTKYSGILIKNLSDYYKELNLNENKVCQEKLFNLFESDYELYKNVIIKIKEDQLNSNDIIQDFNNLYNIRKNIILYEIQVFTPITKDICIYVIKNYL
jgi:hypothetical protein